MRAPYPSTAAATCLLIAFLGFGMPSAFAQNVSVEIDLAGRTSIARHEAIELTINRPLTPADGYLAVFVGPGDVTALLDVNGVNVEYDPTWTPLPSGKQVILVFLLSPEREYRARPGAPACVAQSAGLCR